MGAQSRKHLTNPVWGDMGVPEEMNQDEEFVRQDREEGKEAEEEICKGMEA